MNLYLKELAFEDDVKSKRQALRYEDSNYTVEGM